MSDFSGLPRIYPQPSAADRLHPTRGDDTPAHGSKGHTSDGERIRKGSPLYWALWHLFNPWDGGEK